MIKALKSFFKSVKNTFKAKPKITDTVEQGLNERFQKYLEAIDILDPSYDSIKQAIDFCQESLHLSQRRMTLSSKLQEFFVRQQDLELFNTFTKEELIQLKQSIEAYKTINKEKNTLKNQLNGYDRALDYLVKFETEIEEALTEIEYQENRQAAIKRDMAYIQGEKEELVYSKEQLEQGLDFLYKFSIVLVCALAVLVFVFGLIKITYNKEIFVPLIILSVAAIFLGTTIYIFQRKFRYELQRNALLQVRAVELLNRAKALYINCTGFLNYEYKKYRVRNAAMLRNNWEEYTYQRQVNRRHIAMNNRLQEVDSNIHKLLTAKGIQDTQSLLEELLHLVSLEDKKLLYKEVKSEKSRLERELEDLNIKQEKLWGMLLELQQKDQTADHIITHILQTYEADVEKLMEEIEEKKVE